MAAAVAVAVPRTSFASSTTVIARRGFLKFLRTPQLVWTATMQGVLFLLVFRYIFGGAIAAGRLGYTTFVIPGILTTGLIWQGMGAAAAVTEDRAQGLFDRLRSLPIPRSSVLAGRALADAAMQAWGLVAMIAVSFAVGFRLHGGVGNGLMAVVLIVIYVFAFEWVFLTIGLFASNAQAAQGFSLILVPFTFVSSAYVPVASMPGWLQAVASRQPVTFMVNSVRTLVGGDKAEQLLGHSAGYFTAGALLWSVAIVAAFGTIAVARYRRG
jgi:ABC-2 type transport system permease protein